MTTAADIDRLADDLERVLRSDRGPALARLVMLRAGARGQDDITAIEIHRVLRKTASASGLTLAALLGRGRTRRISQARAVAMYLCRELTSASYPEIGRVLGRDHSTVISACKHVAAFDDEAIVELLAKVRAALSDRERTSE